MFRIACFIGLVHLFLIVDIQGQATFKDSLIRSNPVPGGSDYSFEEKWKAHSDFLQAATQHKDPLKQIFGHIYLFSDYTLASDYSEATRNLLEAERIAAASGNAIWSAEVISRKAVISMRMEKTDEAAKHYGEAARLFGQAGDSLRMAECIEQLGAVNSQAGDFTNAKQQYSIALPLLEKYGTERQMRVALGNFGNIFVMQNQPAEGIPYLERALAINQKLGDREKEAQDLGDLGNAYALLKNFDKALAYFQQSIQIARELHLPEVLYVTYSDMAEAYENMGDFRSAYTYFKMYHLLRDSSIGAATQDKMADLEVKYESQKNELELRQKQIELAEAQESIHYRTTLAAAALFSLVLVIIIALKLRQDRARNAKIHEAQQKILEQDLKLQELAQTQLVNSFAAQRNDLTDLALDITRKNDFVDELLRRIQAVQPGLPSISAELNAMHQFILSHHRLDKEKALLHEKVEAVNHEFYENLSTRFGDLSRSEKDLCGLIRLNLSNKEIAVIKGISPNSAKIARYRLRKRLQLNEQDDIGAFLQRL